MGGGTLREWDAIVLLQMGGPETLDEIEPFLAKLFADPDIIRLPRWMQPLQPRLARYVARRRAPKVRPRYEAMGGGSPLRRITLEQADALHRLAGVPVHAAMRYTAPWARDVVARLQRDGARSVLLLPLYPHYSLSTTQSSLRDFAAAAAGLDARVDFVRDWGAHPAYVDLLAQTCEEARKLLRERTKDEATLLLSAHGVPERYILEGDTYQAEVEVTARLVQQRLAGSFPRIRHGYQSAVGPVKWIGPDTAAVLDEEAAAGAQALVVAPLGFVSDHIETMYDMDTLYREQARQRGVTHYERAPSFNARPEFARVLHAVARDLAQPFEVSRWTS